MRVFFDTNVLMDVVLKRQPFYADSQAALDLCDQMQVAVFVAWHSMATTFYLVAKAHDEATGNLAVQQLLSAMTVAQVSHTDAVHALSYGISDYEDALQVAAAQGETCQWLVTRDVRGFTRSPVPAITPTDFLVRFVRP